MRYLPPSRWSMIFTSCSDVNSTRDPRFLNAKTILAHFQSRQTLLNVCPISRTFRELAEPYLCHSSVGRPTYGYREQHENRRLRLLFRSILQKPALARALNQVFILDWPCWSPRCLGTTYTPLNFTTHCPATDFEAVRMLPYISQAERKEWSSRMWKGVHDGYVLLILAHTRFVETLHICIPWSKRSSAARVWRADTSLVLKMLLRCTTFDHLKQITTYSGRLGGEGLPSPLHVLENVIRIPSLRTFTSWDVDIDSLASVKATLKSMPPIQLLSLTLYSCRLSSPELEDLLKRCNNLKHLVLTCGGTPPESLQDTLQTVVKCRGETL